MMSHVLSAHANSAESEDVLSTVDLSTKANSRLTKLAAGISAREPLPQKVKCGGHEVRCTPGLAQAKLSIGATSPILTSRQCCPRNLTAC